MDLDKLKSEQLMLAKKVALSDDFSDISTVAGCDVAYTGRYIVCAIVVMDYESLRIRETKHVIKTVRFPYIPGFLSYREAPIIIDTYHELEIDPDIMIIDGNGILHPRKMGLASHVGLSLDKPSIGVAKSLLCGEISGDKVILGKDTVGMLLKTKQQAKPIFISQGNKMSLKSAAEIVAKCMGEHKLPEPLHQAHKLANKARRKIKEENGGSLS